MCSVNQSEVKSYIFGLGRMAQRMKALATKRDDVDFDSGEPVVEGEA